MERPRQRVFLGARGKCRDSHRNTRSTQKIWCSSTGPNARRCLPKKPCNGSEACRRKPRDTSPLLTRFRRHTSHQAPRRHPRRHRRHSRRPSRRALSVHRGDRPPRRLPRGHRLRILRRCGKALPNGVDKMRPMHYLRAAALPILARHTMRSRTGSRLLTKLLVWSATRRPRFMFTSHSRTGLVLYTPLLLCGADAPRRCSRFTSGMPRFPCRRRDTPPRLHMPTMRPSAPPLFTHEVVCTAHSSRRSRVHRPRR